MDKIGLEFKSIIAYIIPGYLFLFSLSFYFPVIYKLLGGDKGVPEGSAIIPIIILSSENSLSGAEFHHDAIK